MKNSALKFIICTFQLVSGCRFTATQDQEQRMTEMFGEKWLSQIGIFGSRVRLCQWPANPGVCQTVVWQIFFRRFMAGRCRLNRATHSFFCPAMVPRNRCAKSQEGRSESPVKRVWAVTNALYTGILCVYTIYIYIYMNLLYMHGIYWLSLFYMLYTCYTLSCYCYINFLYLCLVDVYLSAVLHLLLAGDPRLTVPWCAIQLDL